MLFTMGTGVAVAQSSQTGGENKNKDVKQAARKSGKKESKQRREENFSRFKKYAEDRNWIVEAHTLYNKYNECYPIDPTINFVSLDKDEITIQLSFNNLTGRNGIGGITLVGTVSHYKVTSNHNNVNIRFTAMGSAMGPVDVLAYVNADGFGRVTVSGNWGNRITFAGNYKPLDMSAVYKGASSY